MNNICAVLPHKILYVEDEPSIQAFVKILFKKNGVDHVDTAYNGKEALELYKLNHYDLIVTDMIMPVMDGFELINKIKEIDPFQIIVMITGLSNIEDFKRAIELRVNFFIEKPINPKKFQHVLADSLKLIQERKELALSSTLLEQYKHAMDESTILGIVDTKGIITYVNKEFCEASQYSLSEIVGQSFDIFSDDELSPNVYSNIWNTVTTKKRWKGIIKNRSKDGVVYVADALVGPLFDAHNNIIEYIFTGHDVTELELYKTDLQEQLSIAMQDVVDTQKEIIYTMGAIGETRSKETGSHVKRVAEYSYTLGILYGLDEDEAELLKLASPMHDIGKVGIPDNVLNKPARLNPEEFEIMKTHATLGYEMLKGSSKEILQASAVVAWEHHERWDGNGYPRGLKEDETHIYGRITSICDVFDALGSDRVYKKAWELDKILELLKNGKGTQFDPNLIKLFLDNLDKFLKIRDEFP
ncbi:MAG: response regulator [Sulfurimonas sp.]|nr:response regulator [Sulfurimonas sp.]